MSPTALKARQASKIAEIGAALRAAGMYALNKQAQALGLPRSTTYTIIRAQHKSSGITGRIIAQMLRSPQLPPLVRLAIEEYTREKLSGAYGSEKRKRQRFSEALQ